MDISTKRYKRCDLVTLKGRVDSTTSPQLSETLDAINKDGRYKIVIDMSGVEFMSSAGFRALLSGQRNCKRYNRGEIVLASLQVRVNEALELAGFTELFQAFEDVTAAVGHF
jgi:anti-sigma B factor antagonist